ncbi:MAG: helix-turn-helix transcriptional regulator [Rhodobacteraceae bacterium]|nr:helix-turn-helix transcriptional regulator [Paracoccaceae bacterium]
MTQNQGYGQFCPIAVASEVIAERWTPLVLRGLFCGATRYNEIQGSVPRMSSALLSRRLKELEHAGIVDRKPAPTGRGFEYTLTQSGQELFPVLDKMGMWAQKWLRREITSDKNLDPDAMFWELRQSILMHNHRVENRRVVEFQLQGVPTNRRFYWLVFEMDAVDICTKNPGHEIDLWVTSSMRTLVEIWLGHVSLSEAISEENLQLDGSNKEVATFSTWFSGSPMAKYGRLPAARL